ncbi:hypothetical protein PTKIN_Ptkin14bG0004700 [Pterospermum kingtungense]
MHDHPYGGAGFTWTNRQEDSFQARKLDRVMVGSGWMDLPFSSTVEFLPPGVSDHCPGLFKLGSQVKQRPCSFKFFNFWANHNAFLEVVGNSWQADEDGNPMERLFKKLKRLKPLLKAFNREHFSNVFGRVNHKQKELETVQAAILTNVDAIHLLSIEKKLLAELTDLVKAEEGLSFAPRLVIAFGGSK